MQFGRGQLPLTLSEELVRDAVPMLEGDGRLEQKDNSLISDSWPHQVFA